jgi:type II secretory pathway pseudopilin PulG
VGLTLIETTLVVATIALLVGLALPAVRAMVNSFQSEGGTKSIIHAALNSARTMAVMHQRYVGVRFQKACISGDPLDPLKGLADAPQYMIFVVSEERKVLDLANGFRALEGHEPIKLPDTIGVMDLTRVKSDADLDEPVELSDATTFSIVFSPSGKLVVHDVRVRNQDGVFRPKNDAASADRSMDEVFNSEYNIIKFRRGMFIQDDYSKRNPGPNDGTEYGLGEESSCTSFVLYDRSAFRRAYEKKKAWSQYLLGRSAGAVYVSPYTGDLISD